MLDMMHRGFVIVKERIMRVPVGHLRFVGCAGIVFFTAQSGRLLMMVRRLLMVGCGGCVVRGATDPVRRHPDDIRRPDGNTRAGVGWFR